MALSRSGRLRSTRQTPRITSSQRTATIPPRPAFPAPALRSRGIVNKLTELTDYTGDSDSEVGSRLGDDLVLCNISVANFALEDVIPAAAAAGFRSMSVLGRCYRRANVRSGLSGTDLRHLLDDHGVAVTDVEAVG